MKRASWIATAALALGLAPAAFAHETTTSIEHGRGSYHDRDGYHGQHDRYVEHIGRVERLGERLAHDAAQVHRLAERQSHHFDRAEHRALQALHRLDERAQRFQRLVSRSHRHPRGTADEFRSLLRAYGQAANAMESLHARRPVYRAFASVQRTMNELVDYYGGYGRHGYSFLGRGYWYRGPDLSLELRFRD